MVDWIELPHWPVFNVADSAIVCGGILAVLLACPGHQLDGSRGSATAPQDPEPGPGRDPSRGPHGAALNGGPQHRARGQQHVTGGQPARAVPDGLDGERLDAALARMFGLSRTRAAELIATG